AGPTRLSFDHINTNGTDSLQVLVSLNGGIDFTPVGNKLATSADWTNRFFDFASNSATTVIRLIATGGGTTDIGVDNLLLAPAPNCITPLNVTAAAVSPTSLIISWNASVSNPSNGYDWTVFPQGGAPAPAAAGSTSAGVLTDLATGLTAGTTYEISVRANCGGDASAWSAPVVLYFGYCVPAPTSGAGLGIVNVSFGTLNNASGAEPGRYGDYTALTGGDVPQTLNANVTIKDSIGTAYNHRIWVDWNNDLDFNDAGELVYTGVSSATNPAVVNASFNVGLKPIGSYRMRIGATSAAVGNLTPCYSGANGTFEDYTLNITAPPACIAPTALTVGNLGGSSGELSWTASTSNPASGYEVFYNTTGTPATANDIPQATGITGTSYVLGSLTPAVTVYAWVRANCDIDGNSVWTGPVSFTPGLAQIGTGTTTTTYFPIYSCYGYNYSQQIYLASEYTGGTYITKVRFKYVSDGTTTANWNNWTVYMGNTSKTSFSSTADWVPLANLSQVFSGTVTPVAGQWMEIVLNTPFVWNGTSNMVIGVDENSAGYSCTAAWQSFTATA
ncbi:MAG: fibronectin type III domain-containing protein, partial [Flavobacteriales bacterium]